MTRWFVLAACVMCVGSCTRAGDDPTRAAFDVKLVRGAAVSAAPVSLTASDGSGLQLLELTAKIVLEPPLAFTQLELAFRNPEPRRLEGRFAITLPQAASISRLALQIGETFQEGEVVELARANVAYEEALHARRDPALLEKSAGNAYSVRIFPIEASETKRVIVAYSQIIAGEEAAYRLHLAGLPTIDRVRLEISYPQAAPHRAPSVPARVLERRAWRPSGDVLITLTEPSSSTALVHGDIALLHVRPATQSSASAIEQLTVLFDTSASRAGDFEEAIERMRAIVNELAALRGAPIPIQLIAFDQEVAALVEASSDQLGSELTEPLLARGALGATDLEAALRTLTTLSDVGDRILLFSDGIATAGATGSGALARSVSELRERGVQRLDVVTHGTVRQRETLEALVHAELPEAGVIVSDRDPVAAAKRLLRGTERLEVDIAGATWTFPEVLVGVEPDRAYPIFAKLQAGVAPELRLDDVLVPLESAKAMTTELLDHQWARARIVYLQERMADLPERERQSAREAILELSQQHHVLSDHTALVVLETDADYDRHRIARTHLSDVIVVDDGALAPAASAASAAQSAPMAIADPMNALSSLQAEQGFGALGHSRGGGGSFGRGIADTTREIAIPRVKVRVLDVFGKLSAEVIRRTVGRHTNELRFCYEQRLIERPALEGELRARFVISPKGSVHVAAAAASSLHDARLERCLIDALKRWSFPAPEGGGVVASTLSIVLSRDSGVRKQRPLGWSRRLRPVQLKAERNASTAEERAVEWNARKQPKASDYVHGKLLAVFEQLEAGHGAAALLLARAWQHESPSDLMALIALARAAEATREHTLSARAYGSLIDLFPSRADLRRAAGQGLEGLGPHALALAIDSYRKAIELRPDQPSGHRLLGMALWRSGERTLAHAAFERGLRSDYPRERFPGLPLLLGHEMALTDAPSRVPQELLRACVYWETDASNVDLHVYDRAHRHASSARPVLDNGASLSGNVATGYGPECFSATDHEIAYPYLLQAQQVVRGAMGYALGALHILRIDRNGEASFESRPFVVTNDRAFVPLGELAAAR